MSLVVAYDPRIFQADAGIVGDDADLFPSGDAVRRLPYG